ncbi:MAG: alpha-glucosidase C-terminal domain-containing protein, partial [Stenotrophomonas sp.]
RGRAPGSCPAPSCGRWRSCGGARQARRKGRRTMPTLLVGDIVFLETAEPVLMFERRHAGETLLLAFNLSAEPVRIALPVGPWQTLQ